MAIVAMRSLIVLAVLLAGSRPPIAAQNAPLTARDSANLRVTALRVLIDTVATDLHDSTRIWIRATLRRDPITGERQPAPLTVGEWAAIERAFPEARRLEVGENVFLCAPGETVRMPGNGCPIRENGVIASVGDFRLAGDSLRVNANLIRTGCGGECTWLEGLDLLFLRRTRDWVFSRILSHGIT